MAIKIRKQGVKSDEPEVLPPTMPAGLAPESEEEAEALKALEEASAELGVTAPVEELDQFLVTGTQSVSWAAHNQNLVLVGIGAILVVALIGVFIMEQRKEGRIDDARGITEAIAIMEAPVGEEKALDLSGNSKPKKEDLKYDTQQAKFTALAQKIDGWSAERPDAAGAPMGKLIKARAAFGLGKFDEAAALYQGWLSENPASPSRPFVMQAYASTLAAQGKTDDAIKALDDLKALDKDAYGEWAAWQTGVFHESAGNKDKARAAYEALIKDYPESGRLELARMRLDLM
jgi:tetratricopeptide (TPR) repeat protein